MTEDSNIQADNFFIISEAKRCVACGLCLPYCPTYQLKQKETESPRGRISMLLAMANEQLPATERLNELVHHCLLCRECETHCPSSVAFASLMDKGRHSLRQKLPRRSAITRLTEHFTDTLLLNPEWIRRSMRFSWLLKVLPANRRKKLSAYIDFNQAHLPWHSEYPGSREKRVSLFLGCVARGLDTKTLDDAIYVLKLTGHSVVIPKQQSCCGALSLHAGREQAAQKMMKRNVEAFADNTLPVIYTATGCGASLADENNTFSERTHEISHFVNRHWPDKLDAHCEKMVVMLHTPCSMQNSLPSPESPAQLLSRFTRVEVKPLNSKYACCGAAGTKMLTDEDVSGRLREPMLQQILKEKPDRVLTSNIGCALHIKQGLRLAGSTIPVQHPISLVADMLRATKG